MTLPAQAPLQLIPADDAELDNYADSIKEWLHHARGAFADNTFSSIRADLRIWFSWTRARSLPPLPADPKDLSDFIDDLGQTHKPSSIARYIASIGIAHRAARLQPTTEHEWVRLALRRLRRAKGTNQDQADALRYEEIVAIVEKTGWTDPLTGERRCTMRDLRNLAIIMTAYDAMLRVSELLAVNAQHITLQKEGDALLLVPKSKNDQEGQGSYVWLRPLTVQYLQAWLKSAGIESGPVFREIHRNGSTVFASALSRRAVNDVFKKLVGKVRSPENISSHSTRIGACQDLFESNESLPRIMDAGRWYDPRMPMLYNRNAIARRGAMATMAVKQKR